MYDTIPSDKIINQTTQALRANGITVFVAENAAGAKAKLFELLPLGASVMNMTSTTMNEIGATEEILNPGKFKPVRDLFKDPVLDPVKKQQLGAAPEWATGSVHAVTQDGKVMIASATGSQLPAYAAGALHMIWVVGAQKIVPNLDDGFKRIYEYCLPLEDQRLRQVAGVGSSVNKILIINKEFKPARIQMILVKEKLGF